MVCREAPLRYTHVAIVSELAGLWFAGKRRGCPGDRWR